MEYPHESALSKIEGYWSTYTYGTNPAYLLISEVEQTRNVQLMGKKHIQSAGGVGKEIEINCPTSLFTSFMDEGRD